MGPQPPTLAQTFARLRTLCPATWGAAEGEVSAVVTIPGRKRRSKPGAKLESDRPAKRRRESARRHQGSNAHVRIQRRMKRPRIIQLTLGGHHSRPMRDQGISDELREVWRSHGQRHYGIFDYFHGMKIHEYFRKNNEKTLNMVDKLFMNFHQFLNDFSTVFKRFLNDFSTIF